MYLSSLNLCRISLACLVALVTVQSGQSGGHQTYSDKSFLSFQSGLAALTRSYQKGNFQQVIELSPPLLRVASSFSRPDLETHLLLYVGASQLGTSAYLAALRTFLPARDLSIKNHDYHSLYAIDSNIAWVYLEMNNLEAAGNFADQAVAAAKDAHQYSAQLVISRAFIYALNQDFSNAESLFAQADFYAMNHGDLVSAASGWHLQAFAYFEIFRDASPAAKPLLLKKALLAETEAFRLRRIHHLSGLEESFRILGCIYAELGDLHTADVLMDRAVSMVSDPRSTAPLWYFFFWRGWLRVQQGDLEKALPDLRSALELARRLDVVPTDDDRVTFESGLAELYSLFIDAGNRLYLKNHDDSLKAEIFEAAEENRAASLRALVPQPHGWRSRLPAEYRGLLNNLQSAERDLLSHQTPDAEQETEQQIRLLRASLHNDEAQAGETQESGGSTALNTARRALDPETLILTYHLGSRCSWLWTIAKGHFEVYQLPSKAVLAGAANQLTASIRANQNSLEQSASLSRSLFQQIPPEIRAHKRWIIALDQDLFNLPVAALRLNDKYLIEERGLLLTPSVRLLEPSGSNAAITGPLLGLGDGIYNRADPRFSPQTFPGFTRRLSQYPTNDLWHLARLSGSGEEVRTALATWGKGTVLTGADSTREKLAQDLNASIGILHLATHVIPAPQAPSSFPPRPTVNNSRAGLIVLGLDGSGKPEFLDMRGILLQPVKLHLVVMSGCASGDASALAGSGLMGLTRAWLGAGASEVLATRWAVLDDSGPFFTSFYRHLKADHSDGAAEALRDAQIEMIHSNSYRSRPEYWASYFLVGKV